MCGSCFIDIPRDCNIITFRSAAESWGCLDAPTGDYILNIWAGLVQE